jgi:hypothetical protein
MFGIQSRQYLCRSKHLRLRLLSLFHRLKQVKNKLKELLFP